MWPIIGKLALNILAQKNPGVGKILGIANNINSARQTKGAI